MPAKFALKSTLFILGCLSLVLGIIGAVLPLLPTTPFLILSAYLFSKSSKKVHSWLTSLPYFGDAIINWETHRVIRPRAKVLSIIMLVCVIGSTIIFAKIHVGLKIMLAFIGVGCGFFIVTRKSRPEL